MRVLQLCPLWFPIAQDASGGIETLAAQLIDALIDLHCDVTLIATGDSRTRAQLVPVVRSSVKELMTACIARQYEYYEQHQLNLAVRHAHEFDIIHSHIGAAGFMLSALPGLQDRVLHTLHWPVYEDLAWFAKTHPELWLSTVSEFQARALQRNSAERCRTIGNGINFDDFALSRDSGESLLFIGRIERVKGPDVAVQVALQLGLPLTLAGPILDQALFDSAIKPHLNEQIRYVDVVDHRTKNALFGAAGCVLLPFRGAEPFGMVAIEAMACGTPVVALANGALPEIVEPGCTGYLAREPAEIAGLVIRAMQLDRARVRAAAKRRFGIAHVARGYVDLYRHMSCGAPNEARGTIDA